MSETELSIRLTNSLHAGVLKLRELWDSGNYDQIWAKAPGELYAFCKIVSDWQDDGYRVGSEILCNCLQSKYVPVEERPRNWESVERHHYPSDDGVPDTRLLYGVPEEVRSVAMFACAVWPYTSSRDQNDVLRGKHVAQFARVINRTAYHSKMYVQWFVHMSEGIPGVMPRIPTRVLRGILFATKLAEGVMDDFWKLAAKTEGFPVRIFTDPGDFRHRACFLSLTQFAQLAEFFNYAPEEAVVRFAGAYREAVLKMRTITYATAKIGRGLGFEKMEAAYVDYLPELRGRGATPGDNLMELFPDCEANMRFVCEDDCDRIDLDVTNEKRRYLLKSAVLNHIHDPQRHELVRSIFFPSGQP
jgi:hypothetical protein